MQQVHAADRHCDALHTVLPPRAGCAHARSSPAPVSYTHLDVYKRQVYIFEQTESRQQGANSIPINTENDLSIEVERFSAGLVENELAIEVGDVARYIDIAYPNDVMTVQIVRGKDCLLYTSRCV